MIMGSGFYNNSCNVISGAYMEENEEVAAVVVPNDLRVNRNHDQYKMHM